MKRDLNMERTKGNHQKSKSGVPAVHKLKPVKPETMDVTEPENISAIPLELTSDGPVETLESSKAALRPLEVRSLYRKVYTTISINVVRSKLQAYATSANSSVSRSKELLHVPCTNVI